MILHIYTIIHTLISLVAIVAGFVMLFGLLTGKRLDGWTKSFLITTVLTSVTGFGFPYHGFTPAIGVGILSLFVLAIAIYARCAKQMHGAWRWIYVVTAVVAFYFNFFVLVVMAFRRVPALHALAPQQTEPPFALTQLVVLVLFVVLGILALIKFHPDRSINSLRP
jgi:hypothetical protein